VIKSHIVPEPKHYGLIYCWSSACCQTCSDPSRCGLYTPLKVSCVSGTKTLTAEASGPVGRCASNPQKLKWGIWRPGLHLHLVPQTIPE